MTRPLWPSSPSNVAGRERAGVVLFVVFVVVAIAALAGYTFVVAVQSDSKAAHVGADQLQSEHFARSGEAFVASWLSLPREERVAIEEDLGNDIFAQKVVHKAKGSTSQPAIGSFYIVEPMTISELMQGNSRSTSVSTVRTVTGGSSASSDDSKWQLGVVNESGKLHLGTLLVWDVIWPGSGRNALLNLPGMTEETADAILDWIDPDDEPRESGAESGDYSEQPRPYRPRNAVPESLDELLPVRGVTPLLLFGETNSTATPTLSSATRSQTANSSPTNSRSQPQNQSNRQSRSSGSSPFSSSSGSVSREESAKPWSHYLTVVSSERDETYSGDRRVFINDDDLINLSKNLEESFPKDVAKFILLYRQYGDFRNQPDPEPEQESPDSKNSKVDSKPDETGQADETDQASRPNEVKNTNQNLGRPLSGDEEIEEPEGEYVPIGSVEMQQAPPGFVFLRTPFELVNAIVPLPADEAGANGAPNQPSQPSQPTSSKGGEEKPAATPRYVRSPITIETLANPDMAAALDSLSMTIAEGGISGRLNLFAAPAAVIAGLPNLEPGQAEQIVAARNTAKRDEAQQGLAWLAKANVLSVDQLRELAPYLTVGGEVVSFQVIGSHDQRRLNHRYAVTIDASDKLVRRAAFRDLRRMGRPNLFDDLPEAIEPPQSRSSRPSRSKSRPKFGAR